MPYGPDPNAVYPNENIKSVCYIKNDALCSSDLERIKVITDR